MPAPLEHRDLAAVLALALLWAGPVCAQETIDLTGFWQDNAGAHYQVRQVDNKVYWSMDARPTSASVFAGEIHRRSLKGHWADLPGGGTHREGELELRIDSNNRLVKIRSSEVYPATVLEREGSPQPSVSADTTTVMNLALNKPASQSTRSFWSKPNDAQGAVDGVKDGGNGFYTDIEPNPWWQADLLDVRLLKEIRLYNSLANPARARTVSILLSADGKEWRKAYSHDGSLFGGIDAKPLIVDLKGAKARYVRLQLNETNYFHLDEVEIYGTPGQTVAPPQWSGAELLQELVVFNDKPRKEISKTLVMGKDYLLEASGTFDDWGGTSSGVDAVWCYAQWRCGREGEVWDELRIDGKGMSQIQGSAIAFNPRHVYQIKIKGQNRALEFYLADAMKSWQNNSGSVTVRLYEIK